MTTIKIDSEIGYWGISAKEVKRQLDEASGDIAIEISSPGGSVYQGVEIFNAIKKYDKGEVTTIIVSIAASMASYIALAGDTIKAYDNAVYMIHNASIYSWGDHRALRKDADLVESLSSLLAKAYVAKTGKTEKEIGDMLDAETYLFGDEILENGFIDEIITSNEEPDKGTSKALAIESVKSCIAHYQEHSKDEATNNEIAALIKDENSGVNRNQALAKNQKSKQGNSMEKYTKEKFEALTADHAKALDDKGTSATTEERARISGIMALQGDDKVKTKAIEDGSSIGDAAIALNSTFDTTIVAKKTEFEEAAAEAARLETEDGKDATALDEDDAKYYEERKAK